MAKAKSEGSGNVYKIMDTRTGLYSTGGTYPRFTKKGKTWTRRGDVKSHLTQFKAVPDNWEVVEIELREVAHVPADDWHNKKTSTSWRGVVPAECWEVPPNLKPGSPEHSEYVRKLQHAGNPPPQPKRRGVSGIVPTPMTAQQIKIQVGPTPVKIISALQTGNLKTLIQALGGPPVQKKKKG